VAEIEALSEQMSQMPQMPQMPGQKFDENRHISSKQVDEM